jgi:glycosyltransferase involved in cell wall biosynthesis
LTRLLAALADQQLAAESFEVIVVDDGSGLETRAVLEAYSGGPRPVLRIVRNEIARGPGAARNAGWPLARAQLVAFTDDDCVPSPHWLAAGLEAHRRSPGSIVQGRTEPDPSESDGSSLLSRTVRVTQLGPQYETCNIFYPRAVLEALGGFDEGFGLAPGGEDTDLAVRALAAGHGAVFAPEALVHHAVERLGVLGSLREARRWTASVRIFAEHPETRAMLDRGVFWNVWHYLLWRSALSALMPRPLRTLVLARHLLALRERARAAGAGSWAIPFLLVYDVIEAWSIARGALRYRTPVL